MKTTSLFCLVCFLSLSLNTINVKAKIIDYYNIPVIFVNKNEQEVKIELKQEATPPVEVPVLINQQEDTKKVDFLEPKMSSDFLLVKDSSKKKIVPKEEPIQDMPEIYATGKLPEFPSSVPISVPESTKNNYSKEEVIEIIKKYSQEYRLDENRVLRIAKCESGYNPKALSPKSTYRGLFQWDNSFYGWAKKLRIENPDPFNPEHNTRAATLAMSYGLWSKWPQCSKL